MTSGLHAGTNGTGCRKDLFVYAKTKIYVIYKYSFCYVCLVISYSGRTLEGGKLLYSTLVIAVLGNTISLAAQNVSQVTQADTITLPNLPRQINYSRDDHGLKLS